MLLKVFLKSAKYSPVLLIFLVFAGCKSTSDVDPLTVKAGQVEKIMSDTSTPPLIIQGKCPKVSLRNGTTFYRSYTRQGKDDPLEITYQASLAEVTRSCMIKDDELIVNVVAAGRLLAGPKGKEGEVTLPVRVVLIDKVTKSVLYSRLTPKVVTLTRPTLTTQFVFSDPDVKIPTGGGGETLIYVGFDSGPNR